MNVIYCVSQDIEWSNLSEERLTKKEEELICYILKYAIDIVSKIGLCGIGSDLLVSLCKNELKIFKKLKINLSYCQHFGNALMKHSEIRIGNDIIEGVANGNIIVEKGILKSKV